MSSEMTGGSLGGGGHTSESIISSVAARITPVSSGGSVRDDLYENLHQSHQTPISLLCSNTLRQFKMLFTVKEDCKWKQLAWK